MLWLARNWNVLKKGFDCVGRSRNLAAALIIFSKKIHQVFLGERKIQITRTLRLVLECSKWIHRRKKIWIYRNNFKDQVSVRLLPSGKLAFNSQWVGHFPRNKKCTRQRQEKHEINELLSNGKRAQSTGNEACYLSTRGPFAFTGQGKLPKYAAKNVQNVGHFSERCGPWFKFECCIFKFKYRAWLWTVNVNEHTIR